MDFLFQDSEFFRHFGIKGPYLKVRIGAVDLRQNKLFGRDHVLAENGALQLERRIAFRRAMKRAVQTTMAMGAAGIRIQCGGRLGGADIARTERQHQGKVPLQTLRANINYGFSEANTVYGIIGVKCWVCLPEEEEA